MSVPVNGVAIPPPDKCASAANETDASLTEASRGTDAVVVSVMGLGQRLRHLRTVRGWSLRAAAKKSGLSHSLISEVERATAQTTTSRLIALVDALDADLMIVARRGTP